MKASREKLLLSYKEECFKQTDPYGYELTYASDAQEVTDAPSGRIIYFPDDRTNILNFEGINEDYLVFVSTEGVAEPDLVKRLLAGGGGADIVYADEDFTTDTSADLEDINERIRCLRTPWRKPDYSPDTIVSFPYIETFFAVKTKFARFVPAIKQSPEIGDNVRCRDFLLRALERARSVAHVPVILFHRDLSKLVPNAEKASDGEIFTALYERYTRPGYVLCREAAEKRRGINVLPEPDKDGCLVSVIIPSKDQPRTLKQCIRNIRLNGGNVPYEIIVVDNGSTDENRNIVEEYVNNIPGERGRYIYEPREFNFSVMCNMGCNVARGKYFLFMNDDVDAVSEAFIEKMAVLAARPHAGAVGAKLLYPDDVSIQHIGITDINRGPVHKLAGLSDREVHYYCRNRFTWNCLAVTGACLMVSREKYYRAGGFCDKMKVGYNDVDLCLKLIENGWYNIICNDIVLTHHESMARGADSDNDDKSARLSSERALLYDMHPWIRSHADPFYGYMLDRDTNEIRCGIVPDHQVTDRRNKVRQYQSPVGRISSKLSMSIDACSIERAVAPDAEDAYVIEGWALSQKWDNALVSKYLVLFPLDENDEPGRECFIATVSSKYRSDVREVFPDAKNVLLAGFVCRIPFGKIDAQARYRIGVMLQKNTGMMKSRRMALGEIYEPRRGIVKDE